MTVVIAAFIFLLGAGTTAAPCLGQQSQAGGVAASEPMFRLVRSISGSKGALKGSDYVIEDPRTVFYLPEDKQVIVYFEWDGPLGLHHLEGYWKNPEGKVVVLGDFNYEAKQKRFAGYWTLMLNDSMATGIWALETHVDGESAGTHNFQIVVSPRPPLPPPPRPTLTPNEIYKLALPATVTLEKLDAQNRRIGLASGFILDKNLIVTGFENIEGASFVRATLPTGASLDFNGVVAGNRKEDWAVLRMETASAASLVMAKLNSWEVGDRCFYLNSQQPDGRTIVDGNITGTHKFQDVGDRLNLNFSVSREASGTPLLNEDGEVIGLIVSSSLVPGLSSIDALREGIFASYPGNLYGAGFSVGAGPQLAIPISLVHIPNPETPVTSFANLSKSGEFLGNLTKNENILQGTVTKTVRKLGSQLEAADSKFEYQRKDGQISVLIAWRTETKLKSSAILKIYDLDNKLLGSTKPLKVNFPKGEMAYSTWTLNVSSFPAGLYRIDMFLDSDPVWRSFFRLVD